MSLTLAVLLSEEAINEYVNGNPAMYTVQVSERGQSLTSISWVTDDRQYTVSMNKNASEDEKLKEDFINLARSLPTDTDFSSTDNHNRRDNNSNAGGDLEFEQ